MFQVQSGSGVGIVGRGGGGQRLHGDGVGSRDHESHLTDSVDTGDLRVIQVSNFLG